jgi:hypothetical protein
VDLQTQDYMVPRAQTMRVLEKDLKLIKEQVVDFVSLKRNMFNLEPYFEKQGWMNFFDVSDGSCYTNLVKDL